jgi:hypothetical protein
LHSGRELKIYTDASTIHVGQFGLGVCLVDQGTIHLYHDTVLDRTYPRHTVLAEMRALKFAVECAIQYFTHLDERSLLSSVVIFSDVDHVSDLLSGKCHIGNVELLWVLKNINRGMKYFTKQFRPVRIHIEYLDRKNRHNRFYKMAHQTARSAARNAVAFQSLT